MQRLDQSTQTVFADLNQRVIDAAFDADFPENGSFSLRMIKGREYWYYSGYDLISGEKSRKYVGPASDEAVSSRVREFDRNKTALKTRLEAVRMLRAAGLPAPDAITGVLVERIAKAGFFRLRGVLVGTIAFQTYSGLVGARPERHLQTGDIDLAQDHGISIAIDDQVSPILPELREIDATFREIPHLGDSRRSTAFINARGYKVEFLVPNRGSEDFSDRPAFMPSLSGTDAQPLRFLDFLVREPVRSVLLHGGGISVRVPAPARFAIHKLIVAERRRDREKASKDVGQAAFLIEAIANFSGAELVEVWIEAWERGPTWRELLTKGRARLPRDVDRMLATAAERWSGEFKRTLKDIGLAKE